MKILASILPAIYSISAFACFSPVPPKDSPYALDANNQLLKYCQPYTAAVFSDENYEGSIVIHTEKYNLWKSINYLKLNKNDQSKKNYLIFEPSKNSEFKCKGNKLVHKNNKPLISTGKVIYKDHFVNVRFLSAKHNKNYLNDNMFFMLTENSTEYTINELENNISCHNYENFCSYSEEETNYSLKFYPVIE